ncbi:universal stress protein [Sphingobacterium bovistauri]|uniref:Universal stress protein n=1 Tax=Sphingobacterium bovistauri TaxID=2781959 RepID=A0ABS7Z2V3_9SPHI|nr:universal stress protein [Sphingobacterium bovistauri]MCA5004460.1 universal stress protein [Sphingobacterium bovistauri]
MSNKILIPVDFSIHSDKAVEYAVKLADKNDFQIDLLHVFTDHSNIYQNAIEDPSLVDPRVPEAKKQMDSLIEKFHNDAPTIQFNVLYTDGNLYDEVSKFASQEAYNAIVMGTKGAFGLDALLIGSNMFDVFLNTKVPVLAVPYSEKKYNVDKVGLLCNFKYGEIDVLKQAIKVYGKDFELVLIHINTSNESIHNIDKSFDVFIEKIIEETGIEDISYVIKSQTFFVQYKEDISSAIDTVISDELLDVLLVTKSKKSFLRKIIEENIVRRMAYQIQIPKFFAKRTEA